MATVTDLAVPVFVWFAILSFVWVALRLAASTFLPAGGTKGLEVMLELVLCRDREGSNPITVSRNYVYLAYFVSACFPVAAFLILVGIIVQLSSMASIASDTNHTLFEDVGMGGGLSIAALVCWLATVALFVVASVHSYSVLKKICSKQFQKVVQNHFEEKNKQKNSQAKKYSRVADSSLTGPPKQAGVKELGTAVYVYADEKAAWQSPPLGELKM